MSENDPPSGPPTEIPFARAAPPPVPTYAHPYTPAAGYGIPPHYMDGLYARVSKPGVISAIGIFSIVLGSVAIIGSGVSAMQALVQTAMCSVGRMAAAQLQAQAAQAAAAQLPPPGPTGLDFDERQTAINVMASRQPLNIARQAQLDELLAQGGQTILSVEPGKLTSARARGAILASSRGRSPRPGDTGPDLFNTATGSIELYDTNAIFRPIDRSEPIRVAADVDRYQATINGAPLPVPHATTTFVTSTAPSPMPDRAAFSMVMSESGLSFLAGAYLLVIGILTSRGNRAGGRLHLIYALLKLPLIGFGFYAWGRFQASFAAAMAATTASSGFSTRAPTFSFFGSAPTVIAVLAALYPIALLCLLMTGTVREYYRKNAP